MRILIVGATGFVGRSLIPLLKSQGAELLVVGRDIARLNAAFPDISACSYDELEMRSAGFDILVHLAVMNNNVNAPDEAFYDVNVRQMLEVAEVAKRASIARFVLVSSTHALDLRNASAYAASKREGARRLAAIDGIATTTVYLPAVYGDRWSGQLKRLNTLPRPLARLCFTVLSALKPTVHVSRLAEFLLLGQKIEGDGEVILSDGQTENPVYRTVSRSMDLGFALLVLILLWWLLLLVWLLIKMQSPGPGIFAQRRVGRNGVVFTCYKFRTMRAGTVQLGTHEVSSSAVTSMGNVLRKTKVDELPQIINIFRNEISLVGPRPCLPVQTELVEERRRRGVLALMPGITGWSQIKGVDMSDPKKLACSDARYAALQSLLLDLHIILATAIGRGQGDRVR